MIISAPAKINLTLRILGKRPDGFHALESVMQMLSLADVLTISEADKIEFSCSVPELGGDDNLVVRTARLLQGSCPTTQGVRIHLEKFIPTQAGLGGGSSDAAATLLALNEFWEIRLPLEDLARMAKELGSDVPFFLNGPSAIVRGRGDDVTPMFHQTPGYIVLAKPNAGLSTPRVYANLHARQLASDAPQQHYCPETSAMMSALQSNNLEAASRSLRNDLEGPALVLMPELIPLRERILEAGCSAVLLSGSGSTLFGLCFDEATARDAALRLLNDFPWTWAGPWLLTK